MRGYQCPQLAQKQGENDVFVVISGVEGGGLTPARRTTTMKEIERIRSGEENVKRITKLMCYTECVSLGAK